MAQGQKIGEGYLDIEADVDGALADVRAFFKKVDGQLNAEEKTFAKSGEQSGKGFVKGLERSAEDIDRTFKAFTNRAFNAAQEEGRRRSILTAMLGGSRDRLNLRTLMPGPSLLSRMFGGLKSGGKSLMSGLGKLFSGGAKLFSGITDGISKAFSTGLDQAQQAWKTASGFFQQLSNIGGGIGGAFQFAAMGVAVPLVFGLAGALAHLSAALLALPAAAGVAVAAIAPLIVAFKGFGEAVSAGFSGDVDKFNEALKKLAPNARKVAKEIVGLKPLLTQLRTSVQEAFFAPLVGQLTKLGNAVLPTLWIGMSHVAGALGRIAAGFTGLLSSPAAIATINNLFMTTERILDRIGPSLVNFFGALLNLLNAGLPYVERFNAVLAGGLQKAADWINAAVAPGGKFVGWMERAWNVGKQLWEVVKGVAQIAGTMLNAFGDEGTDTLTGLAEKLREINKYLQSDEGAETLHNLGVIVHWAGNAFVFFVGTLVSAWRGLNAVFNFVRGIGPFFADLWDKIVGGVKAVGDWFVWLGSTIWGAIKSAGSAVGSFFAMIWGGIVTAYNAVVNFGSKVIDWFVALPGRILAFLTALPGMISSAIASTTSSIFYLIGFIAGSVAKFFLVTLPGWFRTAWETAKTWTIQGTMAIIAWANALPGQVGAAFTNLMDAIGGWFSRAWAWAKDTAITSTMAIIAWANSLPGRVGGALSNLMSAIGGWFSRAWETAKTATYNGYRAVVNFINGIPGAVAAIFSGAGRWLYSAGQDVIRGLGNGIADMLSWAVDKARNAANRIKQGFLDAFDIGSPSKVMDKEVGRWILPGVVRGMEHTMPQMERYLGSTADMIRGGFNPVVNVGAPNVSVGGTTLIADLGDGIRQAVPVQIMRHSGVVATAANVGNRRRTAWLNTGRTVITGATG